MDDKWMKRCIDLALKGAQSAAPNPMVGSVVVHQGRIIGEGYHIRPGGPHAEVHAIRSVENKNLLRESTLYVNLEPCSHYGRTPACSTLIIEQQIPEVVLGTTDTYSEVSGRGIQMLSEAGIKVKTGILEQECRDLNRRFFAFHEKHRPYIILKWAQSADGFIDKQRTADQKPAWITNDTARMLVHKWRSEEGAILVGRKTALMDNPRLNVRNWHGKHPLRICIDPELSLPKELHLFDQSVSTLILNKKVNKTEQNTRFLKVDFTSDWFSALWQILTEYEVLSLIVEGGRQVLDSFIQNNMWDEARVFTGQEKFYRGVPAPDFPYSEKTSDHLGNCILKTYRNSTTEE